MLDFGTLRTMGKLIMLSKFAMVTDAYLEYRELFQKEKVFLFRTPKVRASATTAILHLLFSLWSYCPLEYKPLSLQECLTPFLYQKNRPWRCYLLPCNICIEQKNKSNGHCELALTTVRG